MLGGATGAYFGAQGGKGVGALITGGDQSDRLRPPIVLPGTLDLSPTITSADGNNYVLVQVEGVYRWFVISDNPMLPHYTEVVSGARLAELTNAYLHESGYGPQVDQYNANNTQAAQDAFVRTEIAYTNTADPNGNPWGTTTPFGPAGSSGGATQVWSVSSQPGELLSTITIVSGNGTVTQIVQTVDRHGTVLSETVYENTSAGEPNGPAGFHLVASIDHQTGVTWTLDRATGQMVQGSLPVSTGTTVMTGDEATGLYASLTGTASPAPGTPLPGDITVTGDASPYTSVNVGTYPGGLTTYDFVNADGDHVWVLPNADTGGRTVVMTTASDRPGEPRTVVYELNADGTRVGAERYFDGLGQPVDEQGAPLPGVTAVATVDPFYDAVVAAFGDSPVAPPGTGVQYASAQDGSFTVSDAGPGWILPSIGQPTNPNAQSDFRHGEILDQNADYQAAQNAAALGFIDTVMGLAHWSQQSDLSHISTLVGMYNQVNFLSGGSLGASTGLGSLGGLGAGLGLLSSIESGNLGGVLANGIGFADAMGANASGAIAESLGISGVGGNSIVPGIGFVMALDSGNPFSIAASGASLLSSLGVIGGPAGAMAAIVITVLGTMFTDDDIPTIEGQAQAIWDDAGQVQVLTTQDTGGGATATGWMSQITTALQGYVNASTGADGHARYGLIPQRLPSLGYRYDADGQNYDGAPGHLYLSWIDADGMEQTRYYDGHGERADGTGSTLAGDFMRLAIQAVVPAWEAETVLAHWQETRAAQGLDAANAEARRLPADAWPEESADGLTQSFSALMLTMGASHVASLVDIDGDGFLEARCAENEAVQTVDLNDDGHFRNDEFLCTERPLHAPTESARPSPGTNTRSSPASPSKNASQCGRSARRRWLARLRVTAGQGESGSVVVATGSTSSSITAVQYRQWHLSMPR